MEKLKAALAKYITTLEALLGEALVARMRECPGFLFELFVLARIETDPAGVFRAWPRHLATVVARGCRGSGGWRFEPAVAAMVIARFTRPVVATVALPLQ